MILVFSVSTTGFSVYEHICYTQNTRTLSLHDLNHQQAAEKDCCSSEEEKGKCCDIEQSFAKYTPEGKTEPGIHQGVLKYIAIIPPTGEFRFWEPVYTPEDPLLLPNPPNPKVESPPAVSERLARIQSYLC